MSILKPILTAKERAAYSLSRVIEAADPRKPKQCFERDISETLSKALNHGTSGILVPPDVLFGPSFTINPSADIRTMTVGTPSLGGYTVGEDARPWIEYIRSTSAAMRLGAQPVGSWFGTSGGEPTVKSDLVLPYESASDEAEWLTETGTRTDGSHDSEFKAAIAQPRRLHAERVVSTQLLAQTFGMEEQAKRITLGAMGRAIDRGVLSGSGGVQPIGLIRMTAAEGATIISHGDNGGAPTYSLLIDGEAGPLGINCDLSTGGYVVSPNVREACKRVPQFANTSIGLLQTINGRDFLSGLPCYTSTYMPDNTSKGSGSNLGSWVVGDWRYLYIVLWGTLEVLSDRYTQAAGGKVIVTMTGYADALHPVPGAFSYATDVLTT